MDRNKKIKILLLAFLIVVITLLSFLFFRNYSIYGNKINKIKIGGSEFKAEIVNTPEKLERGLGNRENICDNCGMLFIFPKSEKHSFWMKGMRFGIDVVWINGNEVVYIEKDVPFGYGKVMNPEKQSDKVLEIKGGTAERVGIKVGDVVEFK